MLYYLLILIKIKGISFKRTLANKKLFPFGKNILKVRGWLIVLVVNVLFYLFFGKHFGVSKLSKVFWVERTCHTFEMSWHVKKLHFLYILFLTIYPCSVRIMCLPSFETISRLWQCKIYTTQNWSNNHIEIWAINVLCYTFKEVIYKFSSWALQLFEKIFSYCPSKIKFQTKNDYKFKANQ